MNFKAVNVSPMEKVFPTAAPSEEGAREKLSGLRGEIVSFQLRNPRALREQKRKWFHRFGQM